MEARPRRTSLLGRILYSVFKPMKAPIELLCERCGYVISGLPREGACPECSRPIPQSHPDHRVGSPWQRRPGPISAVRSVGRLIRRPRAFWEDVAVDLPSGSATLWANCALAAIIFPGVAFVSSAMHHVAAIGPAILAAFAWFFVLLGLSLVESLGVRTIGRLRRFRVSKSVAYAIVGHAAAGWVIGSVAGLAATMIAIWIDAFWSRLEALGLGGAVTAVVGLLAFEIFTYLGLRRMKYANPPESRTDTSAGEAGSPS